MNNHVHIELSRIQEKGSIIQLMPIIMKILSTRKYLEENIRMKLRKRLGYELFS